MTLSPFQILGPDSLQLVEHLHVTRNSKGMDLNPDIETKLYSFRWWCLFQSVQGVTGYTGNTGWPPLDRSDQPGTVWQVRDGQSQS